MERAKRKRPAAAQETLKNGRTWTSKADLRSKLHGLPGWWLTLVLQAAALAWPQPTLQGMEIFAGQKALSNAFTEVLGHGTWGTFEKLDDESQDILLSSGVVKLLTRLLASMPGGLAWLGAPCKSWVALPRSFLRRAKDLPQGSL